MTPAKQDSATYNMNCLLREWDRAPKEKRKQFLRDFINQHWNRSGPELETELAQMASLFLARICVWIKLTYMNGTCLTEQLQVLYIFLSASSSHNYLLEFLEHGGVLCLQELCISTNGKEVDKFWALKVLSCVANAGTRYKETICECYGIRAVAECMAKSKSEETQEAARYLLESLAEGNPRFADQVYKGLIGILLCNSPKAQQLALQTIRILQVNRETANRALIDRIIFLLESLHLEVQSAVIELVRVLMRFDIGDDIIMALIALLKPQREIQLGKLFTEADSDSDSSVSVSDSDDSQGQKPGCRDARIHSTGSSCGTDKSILKSTKDTVNRSLSKYSQQKQTGTAGINRWCNKTITQINNYKRTSHISRKKQTNIKAESDTDVRPLSVFVQQASAAKCIHILCQDSAEISMKVLKMGALSSLLYAMGNLEFPDSQRQASLALEYLCRKYPLVDEIVRQTMGPTLHDEFTRNPDSHYLQMTPLQADILVSNKIAFVGEGIDTQHSKEVEA